MQQQRNPIGSRYYVLSDREQDLVVLQPNRLARRYLGRSVSVRGRFGFNPRVGRLLRIEQISPRR